jgi:hypothetical protein
MHSAIDFWQLKVADQENEGCTQLCVIFCRQRVLAYKQESDGTEWPRQTHHIFTPESVAEVKQVIWENHRVTLDNLSYNVANKCWFNP